MTLFLNITMYNFFSLDKYNKFVYIYANSF